MKVDKIKFETETTRMTFPWKNEIKEREVAELLKRRDRFFTGVPITVYIHRCVSTKV